MNVFGFKVLIQMKKNGQTNKNKKPAEKISLKVSEV